MQEYAHHWRLQFNLYDGNPYRRRRPCQIWKELKLYGKSYQTDNVHQVNIMRDVVKKLGENMTKPETPTTTPPYPDPTPTPCMFSRKFPETP